MLTLRLRLRHLAAPAYHDSLPSSSSLRPGYWRILSLVVEYVYKM
jgi:hypothetical protein